MNTQYDLSPEAYRRNFYDYGPPEPIDESLFLPKVDLLKHIPRGLGAPAYPDFMMACLHHTADRYIANWLLIPAYKKYRANADIMLHVTRMQESDLTPLICSDMKIQVAEKLTGTGGADVINHEIVAMNSSLTASYRADGQISSAPWSYIDKNFRPISAASSNYLTDWANVPHFDRTINFTADTIGAGNGIDTITLPEEMYEWAPVGSMQPSLYDTRRMIGSGFLYHWAAPYTTPGRYPLLSEAGAPVPWYTSHNFV